MSGSLSEAAKWHDAFELLGVDVHATEAQIRTAYRKRSLQLHPDKVRDVPPDAAAERFHRLTVAYEQLMDPTTRAKLQETLEHDREKRKRQSAYDDRRRAMAADLERREQLDRVQRMQQEQKRHEREQRIFALREEGRALRVSKHERELKAWQESAQAQTQTQSTFVSTPSSVPLEADGLPAWGSNDTCVLLKFPAEQSSEMWGDVALDVPQANLIDSPLCDALTQSYGPITSLQLKSPGKKRREVAVLVTFEHGVHAWRAVTDGMDLRCTHVLLQDCWIGWFDSTTGKAAAQPPPRVQAWMERGISADKAPMDVAMPRDVADDFDYDYEARTLARMRHAASLT